MRGYRASFQTQLAHFPSKNCDTAKDTEENAEESRNKLKTSIFYQKGEKNLQILKRTFHSNALTVSWY